MFEEIARDGSQMLMLTFWLLIVLIVIWGAIRMRAYKKSRFFDRMASHEVPRRNRH